MAAVCQANVCVAINISLMKNFIGESHADVIHYVRCVVNQDCEWQRVFNAAASEWRTFWLRHSFNINPIYYRKEFRTGNEWHKKTTVRLFDCLSHFASLIRKSNESRRRVISLLRPRLQKGSRNNESEMILMNYNDTKMQPFIIYSFRTAFPGRFRSPESIQYVRSQCDNYF